MGQYDSTIGALIVGIFFNTFLYGLVTYQFAAYHRTKFNDKLIVRYMVLFLFLLDSFHSISAIYLAWYFVVTNYGNPASLALDVWPYEFTSAGTALAAFVTQLYLGFRIWRLSGSMFIYGIVIALAISSFILGLACSIGATIINIIAELPHITPLVIAWLSMQVITDVFITATLIIIFMRWRGGLRKTDTILSRLIRGAFQTCLFAGIFSLGELITLVVFPSTNLYGMFAFPIGRIYTNTLLDTLLTRDLIKSELVMTNDLNESNPITWLHSNTDLSRVTDSSTSHTIELNPIREVPESLSNEQAQDKHATLPV